MLTKRILTGVTNGAHVSSIGTIAKEFVRILTTNTRVFARIGITTIYHLTSVENDLVLTTVLFLLPVGRQFIISVDTYHPHTTNETIIAPVAGHTANQIKRSS